LKKYNGARDFALYIEPKRVAWHNSIGLPLELPFVEDMIAAGWTGRVYVQCFEEDCLRNIKKLQASMCPDLDWVYTRLCAPEEKADEAMFKEFPYTEEEKATLMPNCWVKDPVYGNTNVVDPVLLAKLDAWIKTVSEYATGSSNFYLSRTFTNPKPNPT